MGALLVYSKTWAIILIAMLIALALAQTLVSEYRTTRLDLPAGCVSIKTAQIQNDNLIIGNGVDERGRSVPLLYLDKKPIVLPVKEVSGTVSSVNSETIAGSVTLDGVEQAVLWTKDQKRGWKAPHLKLLSFSNASAFVTSKNEVWVRQGDDLHQIADEKVVKTYKTPGFEPVCWLWGSLVGYVSNGGSGKRRQAMVFRDSFITDERIEVFAFSPSGPMICRGMSGFGEDRLVKYHIEGSGIVEGFDAEPVAVNTHGLLVGTKNIAEPHSAVIYWRHTTTSLAPFIPEKASEGLSVNDQGNILVRGGSGMIYLLEPMKSEKN